MGVKSRVGTDEEKEERGREERRNGKGGHLSQVVRGGGGVGSCIVKHSEGGEGGWCSSLSTESLPSSNIDCRRR